TLLGVTLLVFVLCQFVPGGPVDQILMQAAGQGSGGEGGGGSSRGGSRLTSQVELDSLKAYYHFDKPIHIRYFRYISNLARGDFGDSFRFSKPAWHVIRERLPVSVYYGLVTTVLT